MRFRLPVIVRSGLLLFTLTVPLRAQNGPPYEVASVKPSQPGTQRGLIGFGGERLVVTAWTLPELMVLAYGQGGRCTAFRSAVDRTGSTGNASTSRRRSARRGSPQAALRYCRTLSRRCSPIASRWPSAKRRRKRRSTWRSPQSMANFHGVGRLVDDRTGLTGTFDMDMEWAPMVQFRQPGNFDPPPDFADRQVNAGPTLFVALREQLGLVLELGRRLVRALVIERVERPSPD